MPASPLKTALPGLKKHKARLARLAMRDLFACDATRFETFSLRLENLLFDFSKNRIDSAAFDALVTLADRAGVAAAREAMFSGKKINTTENRAVLHTALRGRNGTPLQLDGTNVIADIAKVHHAMGEFAEKVREGAYQVSGGKVTDIINIGIGGSDLGPAMAVQALAPFCDGPKCHFVSNVDGADLASVLAKIDPATTLVIIASKTFATIETMTNAASARKFFARHVGEENCGAHFAALSTNLEATRAFGIDDSRTFGFWDFVGGRYSIWSAIGLSLMIAIGKRRFDDFLDGAAAVDDHFCAAALDKNIPVIMALLAIWHRNVWGFATQAILPYDNRLARFPAYLQQLQMESNGKSTTLSGKKTGYDTGAIIWGEPGTNGQHAFYQLIHQGTSIIPCDFLIAAKPVQESVAEPGLEGFDVLHHHQLLVANCLAQSKALMEGKSLGKVKAELKGAGLGKAEIDAPAPHKVFSGNRPSSTFIYEQLTPFTLGMLIALYEHKVFVEGIIWQINSFDQWGVELGKVLAKELAGPVKDAALLSDEDGSTAGLLRTYHGLSSG